MVANAFPSLYHAMSWLGKYVFSVVAYDPHVRVTSLTLGVLVVWHRGAHIVTDHFPDVRHGAFSDLNTLDRDRLICELLGQKPQSDFQPKKWGISTSPGTHEWVSDKSVIDLYSSAFGPSSVRNFFASSICSSVSFPLKRLLFTSLLAALDLSSLDGN